MNLLADSTPLGLDNTWWTALAVIVAVLGPIIGWLIYKHNEHTTAPLLFLDHDAAKHFSGQDNGYHYIRLPIRNTPGRRTAKNVEVYLESISTVEKGRAATDRSFIPMRLTWCHGNKTTCDSIPSGSFRLLDLGRIRFSKENPDNPNSTFRFSVVEIYGESTLPGYDTTDGGRLFLKYSISADDMETVHVCLYLIIPQFASPTSDLITLYKVLWMPQDGTTVTTE